MEANKTVILTGAGAAIPWGAPTTWDITKELISDTTFKSYTGQPIGQWLYHKLAGIYHRDPETINFETIINSVEYLNTFFSSKQRESVAKFKNIMPAFLQEKDDIWEILWFDRIYQKSKSMWESHNERLKFHSFWQDYDDFFEAVHRYFINLIIKKIEEYSSNVPYKTELNNHLNDFLSSIIGSKRCYTTNYDRIIPTIYSKDIFEGFTKSGDIFKFGIEKVLADKTSNVHYNLHGSAHFDLDWPGNVKLSPGKFIYDFGHGASDGVDQDKRKILNSNIITGFNKPSRILSTPYSQYYHRFYEDCLEAEKIYIIGYSFGDIHINNAIRTGSSVNKNQRIVCVSFISSKGDPDEKTDREWIELNDRMLEIFAPELSHSIFESIAMEENVERISIYTKGYEAFLKEKGWEMK